MKVRITRIDKDLPLPKYETNGSVGIDLIAREEVTIEPGEIALIPGITELSIGHAIVARAVLHGFEKAVADMLALIKYTEIMKDIKAV